MYIKKINAKNAPKYNKEHANRVNWNIFKGHKEKQVYPLVGLSYLEMCCLL